MKLLSFLFFIFIAATVSATHLKGGYIRVEHHSGLTYNIIIKVFTNTVNTQVLFGGEDDILDFGDGTSILVPERANIEIYPGTATAQFQVLHTYSSANQYIVTYSEPNRNEGIINIDNSVNTRFYLESSFYADPFIEYASPIFFTVPVFEASLGRSYSFGINAVDPNDYALNYYVSSPKNTANYRLPENFKVNPYNGQGTWDTAFEGNLSAGVYLFNVKIIQTRENVVAGYIILDFQIEVTDQPHRPVIQLDEQLSENNRIYVAPNQTESWKIYFQDQQNISSSLELEVFSEIGEYLTTEIADSTNNGTKIKVAEIEFTHEQGLTRENPYLITIRGKAITEDGSYQVADLTLMIFTMDIEPSDHSITSTDDIEPEAWSVFPNPFTDRIIFVSKDDQHAQLTLYTVDNKILYCGPVKNGELIDLAPGNGVIIYQIRNGNDTSSGKLIRK
jgi:hypothetical protein